MLSTFSLKYFVYIIFFNNKNFTQAPREVHEKVTKNNSELKNAFKNNFKKNCFPLYFLCLYSKNLKFHAKKLKSSNQ